MYAIVACQGLFFAFDATLAVPAQLRFHSTGNWYLICASIWSCPSPFPTIINFLQLLKREYCPRAQRATLVDLYLIRELPVT